jgi:hypothetical protein
MLGTAAHRNDCFLVCSDWYSTMVALRTKTQAINEQGECVSVLTKKYSGNVVYMQV